MGDSEWGHPSLLLKLSSRMSESGIRAWMEEVDGAPALHNSSMFYPLCIPELAFVGHLLSTQHRSYLILTTTHHILLISVWWGNWSMERWKNRVKVIQLVGGRAEADPRISALNCYVTCAFPVWNRDVLQREEKERLCSDSLRISRSWLLLLINPSNKSL